MKVTDRRIYVVDASWRNGVFLKVLTDAGLTGVGEASLEGQDMAVVAQALPPTGSSRCASKGR